MMTLAEALLQDEDRVVAFVGGGGKTTSMYRLAREMAARGEHVVVTTTTHIMAPRETEAESLILSESIDEIIEQLEHRLRSQRVVAVGTRIANAEGKMKGIPPEWVEKIAELPAVARVLVEADGSAGRPFKAPADHEPVIPAASNLVVAIVGVDVVGQRFGPDAVHRPERVAAIVDIAPGEPITPDIIGRVVLHPQGTAKGAPRHARVVPLINKVDNRALLQVARLIARRMLDEGASRVVIARAQREPPVREVMVRK